MDKLALEIEDTFELEATAGEGSSGNNNSNKKINHNAKERLRRLNLNASYTALRYLLPNSKKSKIRWSAPKILERSLKYIPELLDEIRKLTLAKEISMRALLSKDSNNNRNKTHDTTDHNTSITITEVANGEFAFQICAKRPATSELLSNLMCKVETNGMSVKGVSSVEISDGVLCCHLHIEIYDVRVGFYEDSKYLEDGRTVAFYMFILQMNANRGPGIDYIAILRDELASWLNSNA